MGLYKDIQIGWEEFNPMTSIVVRVRTNFLRYRPVKEQSTRCFPILFSLASSRNTRVKDMRKVEEERGGSH